MYVFEHNGFSIPLATKAFKLKPTSGRFAVILFVCLCSAALFCVYFAMLFVIMCFVRVHCPCPQSTSCFSNCPYRNKRIIVVTVWSKSYNETAPKHLK